MFNLDKAIGEWRRRLAAEAVNSPEILDELESHLREEIGSQIKLGKDEEHAFQAAVGGFGEAAALRAEFAKLNKTPARSSKFLQRAYLITALFVFIINVWTLLAYELNLLQRVFGILTVAVISFYLAFVPYLLKAFPALRRFWGATIMLKLSASLIWLWPVIALLQAEGVSHLQMGILPNTIAWCVCTAIVMTAVAYSWSHCSGRSGPGGPPASFPQHPQTIPPTPPLPADLRNLLPRSRPVDPIIEECIYAARGEASRLGHGYIGTEHLLLGLLKLAQGSLARILKNMNVSGEAVRLEIEKLVCPVPSSPSCAVAFTPRARKAIRLAGREAKAMRHSSMGAEHLLIGLVREGSGVGALALRNLGIHIERTRAEILRELRPGPIR